MADINGRTALDLGREIEAGRLDPRALVDDLLARIDAQDSGRVIYVRPCTARARAESQAAFDRAKRGMRLSPLDGVPISWKDLFDTAGIETSGGSALLAGRVPERDATAVARLSAAGTICLGKTNMTELAFSGLGINPVTGTPENPFDPKTPRCPGGSTSGGAVSVARNLAAAAMGSDTGGSIRLPAAWNGLVGLKPTHGITPMQGVLPLAPGFDTIGPLTRDVADAGAMFDAVMGLRHQSVSPSDLSRCVFWAASDPVTQRMDPSVDRVFQTVIARLAKAGARMDAHPWIEGTASLEFGPTLVGVEAFAQWGEAIDANPQAMSMQLRSRFGSGRGVTAAQYLKARAQLDLLCARHHAFAAGYDAMIMPTCAIAPPVIAPLIDDPGLFANVNLLALRNTRLANLLGLPAITVPVGLDELGLPVGMMLVGKPNDERKLLSLAAAIECLIRN